MKFEVRKQNADRVCEGISKIGYKFHAAIEDIIDNSVSASASKVDLSLLLEDGANLSEKSKIIMIRIVDNGCGMTDDIIGKALDLGAEIDYSDNSLSKFGFGLKSAGFSLGRRVTVYSKQNGVFTEKYFLDRDVIKERNAYGVCIEALNTDEMDIIERESGTVVEITKIKHPHDSTNKILKELRERLGVIYHDFMVEEKLDIQINYIGKKELIIPKDILFWELAVNSFDSENYDAKLPCKVIDTFIEASPLVEKKVRVRAVIFPQAQMAKHPHLTEAESALIKKYEVSRKNNGFFVFRNNRLIRWGDLLNIAGRDDLGFRARIDIESCHDEVLQVDVSKQNLDLSEIFLDSLALNSRVPLSQAKIAFKICNDLLEINGGEEGLKTSETLETIAEEDPDLDVITIDKKEQSERRVKNQAKTKKEDKDIIKDDTEVNEKGSEQTTVAIPVEPSFKKVRYSDKIHKHVIFVSEIDCDNGIYIRINKNHLFYNLVLKSLSEADSTRVAIESLLFAMAVGEKKTEENLQSVDYDKILEVFDKFHRVSSVNLENWASRNQDLY